MPRCRRSKIPIVPLWRSLLARRRGARHARCPDRQVVEAQLDAFAADDAERAFSYAATGIRAQFGDANNFMAMVRRGYPMVIRPAAVSFFQPQRDVGTPETVTQLVQLRDREGRLWNATYLLEQVTGAGWRISGCVVAAGSGKSSI